MKYWTRIKTVVLILSVIFTVAPFVVAEPDSIVYNPESGTLTATVVKTPLSLLLMKLADQTKIEIFVAPSIKDEKCTVQFENLPLETAIKRLLTSFSHVIVHTKKDNVLRLTSLKVYPQGVKNGALVAVASQGFSGQDSSALPGKAGLSDMPGRPEIGDTISETDRRPGASGILIPHTYEAETYDGLSGSHGRLFELQEKDAYQEIVALNEEINQTGSDEKKEALTLVMMEKIKEFEGLQHSNRNKMEAFHRMDLFNKHKDKASIAHGKDAEDAEDE